MNAAARRYRAGDPVEDLCRSCKQVRGHSVVVSDTEGQPLRVLCNHCGSQHNYRRGGPREPAPGRTARTDGRTSGPVGLLTDLDRSRQMTPTNDGTDRDLELLLRRIIREEIGLTPVALADKWRDGEMVLRPGRQELQEKAWPIEAFFRKIISVRNRLRALEQQVNASELPSDVKIKLQGHVTACYGSLTSFNVLFADDDDRFRGGGAGD